MGDGKQSRFFSLLLLVLGINADEAREMLYLKQLGIIFSYVTMVMIELQALYTSLVEQGKESLTEALTVGIAIEELDIRDLRNLSEEADNEDLLLAYANLEKGSRNHLRSFTHILQKNGGDYQAQYLTDEEVKAIINSAYERGLVD